MEPVTEGYTLTSKQVTVGAPPAISIPIIWAQPVSWKCHVNRGQACYEAIPLLFMGTHRWLDPSAYPGVVYRGLLGYPLSLFLNKHH